MKPVDITELDEAGEFHSSPQDDEVGEEEDDDDDDEEGDGDDPYAQTGRGRIEVGGEGDVEGEGEGGGGGRGGKFGEREHDGDTDMLTIQAETGSTLSPAGRRKMEMMRRRRADGDRMSINEG